MIAPEPHWTLEQIVHAVMGRDPSLGSNTSYYEWDIAESKREIADLEAMSEEKIATEFARAVETRRRHIEHQEAVIAKDAQKWAAALDRISSWEVPDDFRDEHAKIVAAIKDKTPRVRTYDIPDTAAEWHAKHLDSARGSLDLAQRALDSVREREERHTAWLARVRAALPENERTPRTT